ncbi:MAG: ABC transporter substrate-binding protein [Chloroflexi bacterium]|nr:ABC transporter substrate-binding protein [Chloroflexota bacterium]
MTNRPTVAPALLRRRISRRRALQAGGAVALGAGALAVAGCSSGGSGGPGTSATQTSGGTKGPDVFNGGMPVAGGRLQAAAAGNFDSFDPHIAAAVSVPLFPRIYNVLVNPSPTRPEYVFMDLAQSFENPDALTWVFKVRRGVRIGPNDLAVPERDMDAADVAASFERIKATATAPNGAFVKEFVDAVSASGDTLTVNTTRPYAWFLNRAGSFVNTVPPRELIASDTAITSMRDRSAGGGPFRLARSVEGEGARFDRNPSYYRKDDANGGAALPYVEGIDVKLIPDRGTQRVGFQSGQLHQYAAETKAEADSLVTGGGAYLVGAPAFTFVPVVMNRERAPFDDPRARRAVARAINRRQFIDLIYGGDAKPNGLVHWPVGLGTYAFTQDELDTLDPFNLAEAKALVSALGGLSMKLIYPANSPINQHDRHVPIFIEQLKAAGIDVTPAPQEFTAWLGTYRARDYQASLSLTQALDTPELPLNWHTANGPTGDRSFGVGLDDPEVQAALDKTKTELDLNARIEAVRAAQKLIYSKDPTFLPLVSANNYTVYRQSVHNIAGGIGSTANLLSDFWLQS